MIMGNREFNFKTTAFIKLHDAKITVGAFGSSADFTPPQKHTRIRIEGHIDTKGRGTFKSILMS